MCVGIEDPADLLDDLRHALLEAGAVTMSANDFVRIPTAVNRAVEKLESRCGVWCVADATKDAEKAKRLAEGERVAAGLR